jgi:phage terminase large subunit GpA-like protein
LPALRPPAPVDYLAWAVANIVFDAGSPFAGPWNRALFPYFDAILRALSPSDPCRYVTLTSSAQLGKTEVAKVFALGAVTMSRGTVLVVHPTIENAARWSRMKLQPSMRSIPTVTEMFPQRPRDTSDAILFKERKDGLANLLITGANSPASLSQVTVNYQVQDDLSKFEMNAAGDPEAQADNRSRAIEFAKIFKLSTPLVLPGCRITRDFEAGTQEMPFVPCPHCRHIQVLEWDNMLANLDAEHPEHAHFTCIACGAVIEEHHRSQMLAGFEWRAMNGMARREHRSFWIWSAYSYLQSWSRIAQEWLKARGDPASEQRPSSPTRSAGPIGRKVSRAHRRRTIRNSWRAAAQRVLASPCLNPSIAGRLVLLAAPPAPVAASRSITDTGDE